MDNGQKATVHERKSQLEIAKEFLAFAFDFNSLDGPFKLRDGIVVHKHV